MVAVFPDFAAVAEVSSGGILLDIVLTDQRIIEDFRRFLVDRRCLKRARNGSAELAQPGVKRQSSVGVGGGVWRPSRKRGKFGV